MPQLPSFLPPPPPPPAASSPDTFSVTLLESLTKFALGLMNLAPASGKNGRDRTQSPKAQTKTITYREGSSLRTSNFKLADRMTFPDPKWVTDRRTSNLIGHDEDAASDHFSENDARSDTEEALEDAASAAKAARKTISIRKIGREQKPSAMQSKSKKTPIPPPPPPQKPTSIKTPRPNQSEKLLKTGSG
ncbi:hypothetical protein H4I96_04624 [Botrytis cinerea]